MDDIQLLLDDLFDGLDETKLIREGEDLNFTDVKQEVLVTLKYLRLLSENKKWYYELSIQKQQAVMQVSRQTIGYLLDMKKFTINQERDFQQEWRQIIAQVRDSYDTFYANIVNGLMSFVALEVASTKNIDGDLKKIKSGLKEIHSAAKEIEAIRQNVEVAAGKTSITSFQASFVEQAVKHANSAKNWFKGLIVSGLVVALLGVVFVVLSFNQDFLHTDPRVIIITLTIKLVVLSSAIYFTRICSKNYNAQKHLQTINEHRVNVLGSLPSFIDSVNGDNKDLMITIGAKTAFEAGETGLISTKEGAGTSNDELTRILADFMKR